MRKRKLELEPNGSLSSLNQSRVFLRCEICTINNFPLYTQEPVATFVANDEVYENICAQRIMREELRQKKREIAAIMKKDSASGAYRRNQGGSTAGTDNQSLDTALGTLLSTDMTTAATWGDGSVLSNADGGICMSCCGGEFLNV